MWIGDDYKQRNENFFKIYLGGIEGGYKEAVLKLFNEMFANVKLNRNSSDEEKKEETKKKTNKLVTNMYGMLRTAKFVKGEPEHE